MPRGAPGPVRGRAGRVPPPELPRPRCRRRADHAGCRVRRGARAADRAVLHRPLARVGGHDRARHGRLRARRRPSDCRASRSEGRRCRHGRSAARGGPGTRRHAALRELAAPAGARPRHAHRRDGAPGAGGCGRRGLGGQSGGRGRRRIDLLSGQGRCGRHRRGGPVGWRHRAPRGVVAERRAGMVTAERLAARKAEISGSRDLTALRAHLERRAAPLLEALPAIPEHKALLSTDGGVCPADGAALVFDPWSPGSHRCPHCRETYTGERHDRHWARYQHLWLAERAAHLAALGALADHRPAAARAGEILRAYAARYLRYPNRDNVLGPSRLFFSTYLESLWICNILAAAVLLRESGNLDEATTRAVNQVADEAANLIGEFDEWFSNRQTWNNAALAAIAYWFEDEDLASRAIESRTGLLAHLMRGFGPDGMWYEGENYHLFALRGLLTGVAWAAQAGIDVFAEAALAERVRAALLAPARSALPDFTFPARKDSRFGVSLKQPLYVELWEIGLAHLGMREAGGGRRDVASWLTTLYRQAAPVIPELFESYLHDAPIEPLPSPVSRTGLSWWALLFMEPQLPSAAAAWAPASILLDAQGLAILRTRDRYVSLECGPSGGGHGHPDRLHVTLHADGVHWLPDLGTGSYVAHDLFWYRSTLAHNAPRLDGSSQPPGDAHCLAFDVRGDWAWARGRYGELGRAVLSGPAYVVDVTDLSGKESHLIELPWHFDGAGDVVTPGRWTEGELADEFVHTVERFVPAGEGPTVLELHADGRQLRAHFLFTGELLRATGLGKPGTEKEAAFYVLRARGRGARFVTVLEPMAAAPTIRGVRARGEVGEVETARGTERHA